MSLYHSNPKVTWSGIDLSDFIRDFRFTLDEPKRVADNPHAPGTPEHKDWETVNVHLPRRNMASQARAQATAVADERIARVKAARTGGSAPRTFAYGKTVDDLVAFIESDRGPLVDDFADGEYRTGGAGWIDWSSILGERWLQPTFVDVRDILRGGIA